MLMIKACTLLLLVLIDVVLGCTTTNGCIYNAMNQSLNCNRQIDDRYKDATSLLLCNYDNTTLYLNNMLKQLPLLENVTILNSNFTYLRSPLMHNNLKVLIINNSTLARLSDNFYQHLQHLRVLDLRNNSLDRLPARLKQPATLDRIYLSDNRWNCSMNLEWVANLNLSIVDDFASLKCFGGLFIDKPLIPIAKFSMNSQINCPKLCGCRIAYVSRDLTTGRLEPFVEVNCSHRQLDEMPKTLPNHTTILHLASNHISDFKPMITNRFYKSVLELYLDDNEIRSIGELEGAKWLQRFRVLSLTGNQLVQLPTYALDNALEQNPNMPDAVRLRLGDNPWKCDCYFTPGFQQMLMKYENQIVDVLNVRCSNLKDNANALLPVLDLTRTSVCYQEVESTIRPLDLLNIILALLIILILGKLAYDYYHFKRSGKLPWIATKIP